MRRRRTRRSGSVEVAAVPICSIDSTPERPRQPSPQISSGNGEFVGAGARWGCMRIAGSPNNVVVGLLFLALAAVVVEGAVFAALDGDLAAVVGVASLLPPELELNTLTSSQPTNSAEHTRATKPTERRPKGGCGVAGATGEVTAPRLLTPPLVR